MIVKTVVEVVMQVQQSEDRTVDNVVEEMQRKLILGRDAFSLSDEKQKDAMIEVLRGIKGSSAYIEG